MPRLIEVSAMPPIQGLAVPQEFYWVINAPAPLAGIRMPPLDTPWDEIAKAGFHHVVRLAKIYAPQDPKLLTVIHDVDLEDLQDGEPPKYPVTERKMIRAATDAVVTSLKGGKGVVVHCVGGRGRTGTVIGCTLRVLGYPADEVISYLDRIHKARGKEGWPEAKWQAQVVLGYAD